MYIVKYIAAYFIILTTLCPFSKCSYTLIWHSCNDFMYLNGEGLVKPWVSVWHIVGIQ